MTPTRHRSTSPPHPPSHRAAPVPSEVVHIRIPIALYHQLQAIAKREDRSINYLVNKAVEWWLEREGALHEAPALPASGEKGTPNA